MLTANAFVKRVVLRGFMPALAILVLAAAPAWSQQNTKVSNVLRLFDINGNGEPDFTDSERPDVGRVSTADSDGDGLPDTWEVGGVDAASGDRDVPFPAPTAIIPGLSPAPLFTRTLVRTQATLRDTDGDGLSDFIEVFGLKFIDDNNNGILDFEFTDANENGRWDAGEVIVGGEWADFNNDGMPSIGEFPLPNVIQLSGGGTSPFDFDGFVFTDPTTRDTDQDGVNDGQDNDPLVNPRAFGIADNFFPSVRTGDGTKDRDFDNDGLGNGMDMGNDVRELLDNPANLRRILAFFRADLITTGTIRISEALIEDLLNVDWNGDGLFRLVDVKSAHFGVAEALELRSDAETSDGINLFKLKSGPLLYADVQPFDTAFDGNTYFTAARRSASANPAGLPWQESLKPLRRDSNIFLPDPRIWTVLYAWRVPGFDIDGNGFIGVEGGDFEVNGIPNANADGTIAVLSKFLIPDQQASFDGVIDAAFPDEVRTTVSGCLSSALILVAFSLVGLACTGRRRD